MTQSIGADWPKSLDRIVSRLEPRLIEFRRRLHATPELSGQEFATTQTIASALIDAGLTPRIGPERRGLIVDAQNGDPRNRIAIRGDIDALPIQEKSDCPFRSQRDGVMHACGHDVHTTVTLGVVLALDELGREGQMPVAVPWRGLFQPAEETLQGAREMVDSGGLDGVAAIASLHCDPSRQVGTVGVRVDAFTANCDTLAVTITGRGGHGARPHETLDPVAALAQLINALYLGVPRKIDSQDAVVLSFGRVAAGDTANVIPQSAELRGTLRTLDRAVREKAMHTIDQIARGIALTTNCEINLQWLVGIGSVLNDSAMTCLVQQAACDALGEANVQQIARPSMGSEDFATYLDHVPGVMFRLGCASPEVGNSPLHTPTFAVDERAIAIGVRILARTAVLWSLQNCGTNH